MNPSVVGLLWVLGVPDDVDGYDQLADEVEEEMIAAAERVVHEAARTNADLRLALSGERRLWEHVRLPFHELRDGMTNPDGLTIRVNTNRLGGWVSLVEPGDGDWRRDHVVRSMSAQDWDADELKGRVTVPVPFDGAVPARGAQ